MELKFYSKDMFKRPANIMNHLDAFKKMTPIDWEIVGAFNSVMP